MSADNSDYAGVGRGISQMQMNGILMKQPFGPRNQSTKWTKRFFVLKDGYLLYYLDSDKKEFDKKQYINLHPKGILPLGGCSVESTTEPGHPFCIKIKSSEINNEFIVSAETDNEKHRWKDVLIQSARITWRNAQLGDAMIEQLERQGLRIAEEKQQYVERLQTETNESSNYKAQAEELTKLNEELIKENLKLELLVQSFNAEREELNRELEGTVTSMKSVEETKLNLQSTSRKLETNLQDLETQKKSISMALDQQKMESMKLAAEKQNLSKETAELSSRLASVEEKMKKVTAERAEAERSLKEQEIKATQLSEDKRYMEERAQQLELSIKELTQQKASTEAELREEVRARLEAERRLHEAEESLSRLDSSIKQQKESTNQKQMIIDVKTLKNFFENLAFDSKLDAHKCMMIKHSIQSRKLLMKKSKTLASRNRNNRQSLPPLSVSMAARDSFELPVSPLSPEDVFKRSAQNDDTFQRSAMFCLNSPNARQTVIGIIDELDQINDRQDFKSLHIQNSKN